MISMQDARFYTDILGIRDDSGAVPDIIAKKHEIALGLYRKRGHGGVPDYVMMMIATEYLYSAVSLTETAKSDNKVETTNVNSNNKR